MNQKHRDNLLKLARYLWRLPEDYDRFSMGYYEMPDQCGTACCAVGHGPQAGCGRRLSGWSAYQEMRFSSPDDSPHGDWMFSGGWCESDNTVKGAAKRIAWFLEFGVPKNAWDQQCDIAPLCYADWTPTILLDEPPQLPEQPLSAATKIPQHATAG